MKLYEQEKKSSCPLAKWCSTSVNVALCSCHAALSCFSTPHYLKNLSIKHICLWWHSWQDLLCLGKDRAPVRNWWLSQILLMWFFFIESSFFKRGFLKQHVGWMMVTQRIQGSTLLSGWPWSQLRPHRGICGTKRRQPGYRSIFSPAPRGAREAPGLGCGTGSSWWDSLWAFLTLTVDLHSNTARSVPGRLSPDPPGCSSWRCSAHGSRCVSQLWPSLRATTLTFRLSNTLLALLFLHSTAFPLRLATADVAVQAPNSKCQSKGTGFSASQLVSTHWSLRYLPRALRDQSWKNAEVF